MHHIIVSRGEELFPQRLVGKIIETKVRYR